MPIMKAIPRRTASCAECRARKVKCSKQVPCSRCLANGNECTYPISRRGQRKPNQSQNNSIEQRLSVMEDVVRSAVMGTMRLETQETVGTSIDFPANTDQPNISLLSTGPATATSLAGDAVSLTDCVSGAVETCSQSWDSSHQQPVSEFETGLSRTELQARIETDDEDRPVNDTIDEGNIWPAPQLINWEHQGLGSWWSICSEPGIAWVSRRTGSPDFGPSARHLISTWTRRLKLDYSRFPLSNGGTEPDEAIAWKYCKAYFEESFDSIYGVVDRMEFETTLRAHYRQEGETRGSTAWYALRNTVFASGCRIALSKDASKSFSEIESEAWGYFANAFSVYTELMFTFSGLLAVRALIAMSLFTEGLGSPSIQYLLCSNATRMAYSKGLHRQPAKSWNLSENEVIQHNWLFWAIYCCEKNISQRSGCPSAIDDDDITCQIPDRACVGSTIEVDTFKFMIQHAKIVSQISKRLLSVRGFAQPTDILITTIHDLERQLLSWRDSLPELIRPKDSIKQFRVPKVRRFLPAVFINCAYYGNLLNIYTILTWPWIKNAHPKSSIVSIDEEISRISEQAACAARSLILIASRLEISAASHQWSSFYYPMLGLTNLFINLLKCPTSPTAQSDIALFDVAAGYFGQMAYNTTPDLNHTFARDVATLARKAVAYGPALIAQEEPHSGINVNEPAEKHEWDTNQLLDYDYFNIEDWTFFSSVLAEAPNTENMASCTM